MHLFLLFLGLSPALAQTGSPRTIIPLNCFDPAVFTTYFNTLYPWGSDHNGAARMATTHLSLKNNAATITAQPVKGQKDAIHGGRNIPIHYLASAFNAKQHFAVAAKGGFDFTAEFQAPVAKGTWPAFWLTYVDGWPPEIDLAEWKGSGKISFNTFNTSSIVSSKDVAYPNPGGWHKIKTELRDLNGKDVQTKFYMDGTLVTTQVGKGYIGKAQYLIVNLQMEGSSGSPGPAGNTTYSIRNLEVLSYNP
ncbi:concanavalin A-like lectin/glucanase domain-containing protein [Amylocarpus encephaloides]|uniref:Concanavalin A-like lectin/glucanase domain-containing protein n=1 Tax=Amylocarpus encephaloides TaxID=45428 RepID=A0A9P7YAW5_9HELO|nr:concanavalin A-like lectin/glucanase domain-containing protein [Amylocarpus encephaloides]